MEPQPPRNKTRENLITFTLVTVVGGIASFFLYIVSLGIFAYVLGVAIVVVLVGYLHFMLWGEALSNEVAGEREEHRIREQMEAEGRDI
jgi:hypothetical protein